MSNEIMKRQIAITALNKMMRSSFFDICAVRDTAKLLGVSTSSEAMQMLHALHCCHWADMPAAVRNGVPGLIRDALGEQAPQFYDQAPAAIVTIELAAPPAPPVTAKSLWRRLGFGHG